MSLDILEWKQWLQLCAGNTGLFGFAYSLYYFL
jgi:hypothetical protein